MNSDEVNWLLQTIEDPENANYDTAKDSSCHDALTETDVIEVLATSLQRRRKDASSQRRRNMEVRLHLAFISLSKCLRLI
jgi:hypothetical protein